MAQVFLSYPFSYAALGVDCCGTPSLNLPFSMYLYVTCSVPQLGFFFTRYKLHVSDL